MAKTKQAGEMPAPASAKSDKDWEAEDALRTMTRAEEHKSDPDMMKRVGAHAKKQSDAMSGVLASLQKQGLVSDKAASKIANRRTAPRK